MKLVTAVILVVVLVAAVVACVIFVPRLWRPRGPIGPVDLGTGDWPVGRGDLSMSGVAPGELPDRFQRLWRFKADGAIDATAVIVAGRVFVGTDSGTLYALRLTDGRQLWKFATDDPVDGAACVHGGRVFFATGGGIVYALDAATGRKIWKRDIDSQVESDVTVVPLTGEKAMVLVAGFDSRLFALDAADGKELWTFETEGELYGPPAVVGDRIIFGGRDGVLRLLTLAGGEQIDSAEVGLCIPTAVAVADGRAYMPIYEDGLICVNVADLAGRWAYAKGGAEFFSAAAIAGDRAVIGARDGKLHCVDVTDGSGVWTFKTGDDVDSSPVIVGDKVVVGCNNGRLYVVDLTSGRQVWKYNIGDIITASPALAGKAIVIGAQDGYVYAFGPLPE